MKATINKLGILKIHPESEEEEDNLREWRKENKRNIIDEYILFGRYKNL